MQNTFKTAEGSLISFEWKDKLHNFQSKVQEKPVYEEVLIGTIRSTGQAKSSLDMELMTKTFDGKKKYTHFYQRYLREIEQFLNNENKRELETPLEVWGGLKNQEAFIRQLKAINIETVEDLANVTDAALENIGMGARKLRNAAQDFLKAGKDETLAVELAVRKSEEESYKEKHSAKLKDVAAEKQAEVDETRKGAKKGKMTA